MATQQTIDPDKVTVDSVVRFGLLRPRVDQLKDSISANGVEQPIRITKSKRLVDGLHRLTAVQELNKAGAGIKIPFVEAEEGDEAEFVKRQVAANVERQDMTPMDKAVAMRALLDKGVPKDEVAKLFAVPGGRKGLSMQPLSPASLAMHLFLLELPKAIQTKVHDGRLPIYTAWQLRAIPEGDREAVLAKAEESRIKALDADEKLSAKVSKVEETEAEKAAKAAEAQAKVDALKQAAEAAQAETAAKLAAHEQAVTELKASSMVGPLEQEHGKPFAELPDAIRKAFAEKRGVAKAAVQAAEQELGKAKKAESKAVLAYKKVAEPKAPKVEEPKAEGKAAPAKKAAKVSPQDIAKAAKDSGVKASKTVALDIKGVRDAVKTWQASGDKKVKAIAAVLADVMSGKVTPGEALKEFAKVK